MRQYDAVVGRWLSTDPCGQHWSPYLGMGNSPMNRIDPDGGFDWYTNDQTGELHYFEGESGVIDGHTWIADDNASLAEINSALDFFGLSDQLLSSVSVSPSYTDLAFDIASGVGRDFVNNIAYVGQGVGRPIWHNFDREILGGEGFENGVLPYTFDEAWNWRQKDHLDYKETVHRTVGTVVTVISVGLPGSAVIGSSSTVTNVVGGFAVKQTAGTVIKKSIDYSIGYHE
ncbi:hypothetical protein [Tunicatimonas pelagia]|uniref:hypothetical protein n=1 Tax=Tunicatimonas pelagia TaxID=931531 RepID=UPI002666D224|nr:hypothetical protein [Tunicatimonas pelagia]WKN45297.1 hypothetical protein P0M28_10035 [Tunicatimonas pelagia]